MHLPNPDWGTHIPVLIEALRQTKGPVLELGMGISSTPLLHALCKDRLLVSYDDHPEFLKMFRKFRTPNHLITQDIPNHRYSVVLVDQSFNRKESILKYQDAEYLVVHDTEPENDEIYHYSEVFPLFKYRHDTKDKVRTTVLSNDHQFHHSIP